MLEKHWNGDILDTTETTLKFAATITWKGKNPVVELVQRVYETGKRVKKDMMNIYAQMIERSEQIGKWSVTIKPEKCKETLNMEIKT